MLVCRHESLVWETFAWTPQGPSGCVVSSKQEGRWVESLPPPKCPGCCSPLSLALSSCITLHQWPQIWTSCVSLGLNRKGEGGEKASRKRIKQA